MKRFGQFVVALAGVAAWGVGTAQAQSATTAKWSGQIDVAATLGHKSSSSFGGELDYRWQDAWDLYFEGGHMGNVTTGDAEDRASLVGDAIGASANPVQKATYYDFGVRYHLMPDGKWNPYVALGFGAASVKTTTTFAVNGADISGQLDSVYGVQLGVDLGGTATKPLLLIGTGIQMPLKQRYFIDASYRYGRIFPKGGLIDDDQAINTQRFQLGFGLTF